MSDQHLPVPEHALEPESSGASWFDRIERLYGISRNPMLGVAAAVSLTVLVGIPVEIFADDLEFPSGLIVGVICGVSLYGLWLIALTFLAVLGLVVDAATWLWRVVVPRP
jgi:hypothetical protein